MKIYSATLKKRNMIKRASAIFLTIGILSAAVPLLAIEFGVKAGANLSFVFKPNEIYNASNLLGIKGGVFASLPLGGLFSWQPEINYVVRGGRYYSAHVRGTRSARFNYLEIPVLVNLSLKGKSISFFIGPYYGILLSSTPLDDEHDWCWKGYKLKRSDAGLAAGFRWRLKSVFVELQYTHGLMNLMTDPNSSATVLDHKNHCAALLIGYVI